MTTETTTNTSSEDVSGLKSKISELFGKLKEAEKRADAAEKLADEAEANAAAGNELKTLQREHAKLQKSFDALTAERDTFASELRTTRVDSAISAAIASGNVLARDVEAVESILHRKVEYVDGEASIAGQSIADFAKSYFAKDGAHYVRAADNSGADSQGSNGTKAPTHNFTKETYNHSQYAKVYLNDPQLANSIADQVGRPDLKTDV